jgi:hypothetical protein
MRNRKSGKHTILSGPSAGFGPLDFSFIVFISLVADQNGN